MRLDRRSFEIWLVASVVWLLIAGGWSYLRASADLVRLQIDHHVMFLPPVILVPCDPPLTAEQSQVRSWPWSPAICLGREYDPTEPTLMDAIADNWATELTAAYLPILLFYLVGLWVRRRR